MKSNIIRRPLLTEKATLASEKQIYTFEVEADANKMQIAEAVEARFGVNVVAVRTMWGQRKSRTQFTKKGVQHGSKPARKKAVVTLKPGQTIDIFAPLETKEKGAL